MDYKHLKDLFCRYEGDYPQKHLTACITFSSFGSNNKNVYPWHSRTYVVSSNNKAFQPNKGGYSIFGNCLDGSDQGVRLEQYMEEELGGQDGWVVEDLLSRRLSADQRHRTRRLTVRAFLYP